MLKKITLITGNLYKVAQISKYINFPLDHKKIDLPEIQSLSIKEVVEEKVKTAYKQIKSPVLIDDTALEFEALGKLPGTFIKFFVTDMGNEKICRLLDSFASRKATAYVALGFYDGRKFEYFESRIEGSIPDHPKGDNGYGWDSIFILAKIGKTYAELEEEKYHNNSIRLEVCQKFVKFLENYEKK